MSNWICFTLYCFLTIYMFFTIYRIEFGLFILSIDYKLKELIKKIREEKRIIKDELNRVEESVRIFLPNLNIEQLYIDHKVKRDIDKITLLNNIFRESFKKHDNILDWKEIFNKNKYDK